jgi:hypothetical protein
VRPHHPHLPNRTIAEKRVTSLNRIIAASASKVMRVMRYLPLKKLRRLKLVIKVSLTRRKSLRSTE